MPFLPLGRLRSFHARVKNVADIFANLSFAATNVPYIAASRPIVQFQLQSLRLEDTSAHVSIRASALTVLVNIASSLRLEVRSLHLKHKRTNAAGRRD